MVTTVTSFGANPRLPYFTPLQQNVKKWGASASGGIRPIFILGPAHVFCRVFRFLGLIPSYLAHKPSDAIKRGRLHETRNAQRCTFLRYCRHAQRCICVPYFWPTHFILLVAIFYRRRRAPNCHTSSRISGFHLIRWGRPSSRTLICASISNRGAVRVPIVVRDPAFASRMPPLRPAHGSLPVDYPSVACLTRARLIFRFRSQRPRSHKVSSPGRPAADGWDGASSGASDQRPPARYLLPDGVLRKK